MDMVTKFMFKFNDYKYECLHSFILYIYPSIQCYIIFVVEKVSSNKQFMQEQTEGSSPTHEMEEAVVALLQSTRDLRHQLQATTMAQAADLTSVVNVGRDMVNVIRNVALASDTDRLMECADKFHEYIEHILEVSYVGKEPKFVMTLYLGKRGSFIRFVSVAAVTEDELWLRVLCLPF